MAAGVLPAPGTKYGPCLPDCFTEGRNNERPISNTCGEGHMVEDGGPYETFWTNRS